MKRRCVFLAAWAFLISWALVSIPLSARASLPRQNDCPIILVNAAFQWGRGDLFNYNSWGGNECDIQEELKARGYMTYTPYAGPYSSTWDRACELYAQIKGGTVDYGVAHSRTNRHARFGRTYPGFYPRWGEINPATGRAGKVHLVGMCFGGLTIRFLPRMLEKGVAEEIAATPKDELSPLFSGGHSWVLSATTIVTPHDGTSLLDFYLLRMGSHTELLKILFLIAGPGLHLEDMVDYDVMLDQWGIEARKGESMGSILNRIATSGILNNKDFCNWDMDPFEICRINAWARAMPDVYYFSQAADCTYEDFLGFRHPLMSMQCSDWSFSGIIGSYTRNTGAYVIDRKWFANDGSVNTISMSGPKVNSTDVIVPFNGVPQIGKWNYLGVMKGIDHYDLIGVNLGWCPYDPLPWWLNHAAVLGSLSNN